MPKRSSWMYLCPMFYPVQTEVLLKRMLYRWLRSGAMRIAILFALLSAILLGSCSNQGKDKAKERAKAAIEAGDLTAAESAYTAMVRADSADVEALFYLGVALQEQSRFEEALPLFSRVLAIDSSADNAAFNRGNCWYGMNEFAKALADYEYVLELDPERWPVYNPISHMRWALGDSTGACEAWSVAKTYYADRLFDPQIVAWCEAQTTQANRASDPIRD